MPTNAIFPCWRSLDETQDGKQWEVRWWNGSTWGVRHACLYGCFLKWWYPEIIHFNRDFHYKSSILGYPLFLETPICFVPLLHLMFFTVFSGVFAHSDLPVGSLWVKCPNIWRLFLLGLQHPCRRYVWITLRGIGGVCRLEKYHMKYITLIWVSFFLISQDETRLSL